jgi:hypothetical protein
MFRPKEVKRLTAQALKKPPGVNMSGSERAGILDYTRPGTTQSAQNPNIAGDKPYANVRDAQNARLAEAKIEARRAGRGTASKPAATPRPDPVRATAQQRFEAKTAPKVKTVKPAVTATAPGQPGLASKAGALLKRPFGTKAALGSVRGVAGRAFGVPGLVGTAAYYAGDALKDTDTAQAIQRPIVDALAKVSGVDDIQQRMLSDDPAVSKAAVAQFRAKQAYEKSLENPSPQAQAAPGQPVDGVAPTVAPAPVDPQQAAVDTYTAVNAAPPDSQVNAKNPAPIPGAPESYAGQYGQQQILSRPTLDANGQPVIDPGTGKPVPNFTDTNTAFNRPALPVDPAQEAEDRARAEQARADYIANTTGSDGRRYFGGSETEALRARQMEVAKQGDPDGTVAKQLANEGLTPEQRAAYAADPAGAYQVDAQANSDAAANQLSAFKSQYEMQRNAKTDYRLERTAAMKEATELLEPLKLTDPETYARILAQASELYDPSSGETMSQLLARLVESPDAEGQQVAGAGQGSMLDTFF